MDLKTFKTTCLYTMKESFTKHLPFSLLAKYLKKTKFWSAILSFWDFLILILCSLPRRGVEKSIKKEVLERNPQIILGFFYPGPVLFAQKGGGEKD